MLYPKVVGQSGTAKPTPLLVTIPPLQIRNSVAMTVNRAKRWSHFLLPEVEPDIRFDFCSDTEVNHRAVEKTAQSISGALCQT